MKKEEAGSAFAQAPGYHALTPELCGIRPYYQDDAVTIYHGDCRQIVPLLGKFDLLLTDPPYGVNLGATAGAGKRHGLRKAAYLSFSDTYEEWLELVPPVIAMALSKCERGAVFTGQHIHEQKKPDAIGGIYAPSAAGRHGWGFKSFLPVLFYGCAPDLHKGSKATAISSTLAAEENGHPCPKPLEWMTWLVGLASRDGETILDPFAGSGTTGRAAKDLGRKAVLIEREESYCEIAARRMAQEVLPLESHNVKLNDGAKPGKVGHE